MIGSCCEASPGDYQYLHPEWHPDWHRSTMVHRNRADLQASPTLGPLCLVGEGQPHIGRRVSWLYAGCGRWLCDLEVRVLATWDFLVAKEAWCLASWNALLATWF